MGFSAISPRSAAGAMILILESSFPKPLSANPSRTTLASCRYHVRASTLLSFKKKTIISGVSSRHMTRHYSCDHRSPPAAIFVFLCDSSCRHRDLLIVTLHSTEAPIISPYQKKATERRGEDSKDPIRRSSARQSPPIL